MTEQDRLGCLRHDLPDEVRQRHGSELGVDERDGMPVIDQRAADGEKTQRRQMVVGDPAADRRMGHVDEQDLHRVHRT
ncbi:hypothetical protein MetexDRAFT_2223 [Methylorubrum extorquens DSM 13060]|jgi:hypothetical protein|uniref:Uncharacterized protein n=1 Tax=Methylorubrum extorquens DSM 13060 TaxID=882800 RepID=H1KHW1_METEX|nr:hypothetical protein MetexDRAFT_2223 [Methylorubrum extorquens DSM 13060]MCP1544865.1 hypothetical protein [Methylorubrum extorquens]MCP1587788.1 hypothetical protein [Methylorubrum extorquens]BDL41472.1 hypothetical protein MSPGM_40620 [Methylorubrum sp. GM97]